RAAQWLPRAPRDQRGPGGTRSRLRDARPPGHGDHLLRPRRRAATPRQPGERLDPPSPRGPANARRTARPPPRVQPPARRARPFSPALDPAERAGPAAELRATALPQRGPTR